MLLFTLPLRVVVARLLSESLYDGRFEALLIDVDVPVLVRLLELTPEDLVYDDLLTEEPLLP